MYDFLKNSQHILSGSKLPNLRYIMVLVTIFLILAKFWFDNINFSSAQLKNVEPGWDWLFLTASKRCGHIIVSDKKQEFFPTVQNMVFKKYSISMIFNIWDPIFVFIIYSIQSFYAHNILFFKKLFLIFWEGRKHCGMWHTHICSGLFFLFMFFFITVHQNPQKVKNSPQTKT